MKKQITSFALLFTIGMCAQHNAISAQTPPEKWTPFRNIEQIEYCLSLPLDGYARDARQSDERAKHVFAHRSQKKSALTVQGLHRSDTKTSAANYYQKYFEGAEEKGLIIESRAFDGAARRFYSTGYWSNSIHESRFVEIVWLRDSEVVKLYASFPVTDAALWHKRLDALFKQTSVCKS